MNDHPGAGQGVCAPIYDLYGDIEIKVVAEGFKNTFHEGLEALSLAVIIDDHLLLRGFLDPEIGWIVAGKLRSDPVVKMIHVPDQVLKVDT